jgi:hypothetical protein
VPNATTEDERERRRLRPIAACFVIAANLALLGLFFAWGEYVVMLEGGIAPASVQLPHSFAPEETKRITLDRKDREAIRSHRARPPRTR